LGWSFDLQGRDSSTDSMGRMQHQGYSDFLVAHEPSGWV
jgi:hypothetical protein